VTVFNKPRDAEEAKRQDERGKTKEGRGKRMLAVSQNATLFPVPSFHLPPLFPFSSPPNGTGKSTQSWHKYGT
jgi:hypothetical protein